MVSLNLAGGESPGPPAEGTPPEEPIAAAQASEAATDAEVHKGTVVVVALQSIAHDVVPFLVRVEHILKIKVDLELRRKYIAEVKVGGGAFDFIAEP